MLKKDKILHFSICAAITFVIMLISYFLHSSFIVATLAGVSTSAAAACGKEYGDKVNPYNKWDWKDILADAIGIVIGFLLGSILWLI